MKKIVLAAVVAAACLVAAPAQAQLWGVVVASIDEDGDTSYVAVTSAFGRSLGRAEAKAMNKCNEDPDAFNCKVVRWWNQGCYYITSGKSGRGTGKVGWGAASTKWEAINQCESQGLVCAGEPIGGCIENDDEDGD